MDAVRERLRGEGREPILAGVNWALPGELGVYCAGHPPVYSIGLAQGDRHSQYDFWDGPVDSPEAFRGKTFIVIGAMSHTSLVAFARLEPTREIVYVEEGRPLAAWSLTVCHGLTEFPKPTEASH